MKAAELIEKLRRVPPDDEVYFTSTGTIHGVAKFRDADGQVELQDEVMADATQPEDQL